MDNLNNTSCEPMDIDLSVHSNSAMDISLNSSSSANDIELDTSKQRAETYISSYFHPPLISVPITPLTNNTQQITDIKKFHINIQKETISYTSTKIKIVSAVLLLLLSVMTYQILDIQCSGDINIEELRKSLVSKLFGQSQAINSLIEALSVQEINKILFFYGGTGVGKTLAASLILNHIGYYSNVYHYTMPSFMDTFTTEFMIGLTVCKHTTIIVDDLSAKDKNVRTHIKDVISKSQSLDKNITVILIYNCDDVAKDFERQCDESFPSKLLQDFSNIDAFKKLIKFEPLKEDHLRKCIEAELGMRKISNIELEKLLKNFNVTQDGCKGVYTKMKFWEVS